MSSPRRNSRNAFFSIGVLVAALALGACSETPGANATIALQVSPGVTLSKAGYWIIAPDGTVTTGTVAVGSSATVLVVVSGLPAGSGYQLLVSGLASDGVTGCSGSSTFSSPAPSTGVVVHLVCAAPPAAGQLLVTSTLNSCPIIDGVNAVPSAAEVGGTMTLQVTAHDPDSGPAALTYGWSANGGALNATGAATATFTCTQPGSFNITVAPSDGDATCGVAQTFVVTCTES